MVPTAAVVKPLVPRPCRKLKRSGPRTDSIPQGSCTANRLASLADEELIEKPDARSPLPIRRMLQGIPKKQVTIGHSNRETMNNLMSPSQVCVSFYC